MKEGVDIVDVYIVDVDVDIYLVIPLIMTDLDISLILVFISLIMILVLVFISLIRTVRYLYPDIYLVISLMLMLIYHCYVTDVNVVISLLYH